MVRCAEWVFFHSLCWAFCLIKPGNSGLNFGKTSCLFRFSLSGTFVCCMWDFSWCSSLSSFSFEPLLWEIAYWLLLLIFWGVLFLITSTLLMFSDVPLFFKNSILDLFLDCLLEDICCESFIISVSFQFLLCYFGCCPSYSSSAYLSGALIGHLWWELTDSVLVGTACWLW